MAPFLSSEDDQISETLNAVKISPQGVETQEQEHNCLPVSNPGDCFWQTTKHALDSHRSTEQLPSHTDILIIGGGYSGVATAYHLTKETNQSITLLEARGACSGATGRNGGHCRPDFYGHIPTYIDRAGEEAAVEIAKFEIAHVKALKKVVEDEKIECDFTLCRSYDVWCNEKAAVEARAVYERMKHLDYMDDVVFYSGEKAEGMCGIKGAKACASFTAATIWPYKFILAILELALATGKLNLQTHTPATSMIANPEGGWIVDTPRGKLYAKQVVHASNAYVSGLLPEYKQSIVPCKGICCRITVPEGSAVPLLNNSYINRTEDSVLSYLIPRADGSIIVGGAQAKFKPFRDQWYGNVDDSVLIDSAKDFYEGYMQRTYRGWEDSEAKIDKIWTGVMGYSYDLNPHVGHIPGRAGQSILAGLNGHGMPVIWQAAKELAKIVGTGVEFEKTDLPKLFKSTQERIDRARNGNEEDGDILGTGRFMATKP